MEHEKETVQASYEIKPDKRVEIASRALAFALTASGIAAVALAIAAVGIFMLLGQRNTINSQAARIHALDQSNIRMAGQISTLSNRQSEMQSQVTAADNPASDSNLITCSDLRHMNLTATNGGSVSAVPGTVSLNQSAVPLPGHCR